MISFRLYRKDKRKYFGDKFLTSKITNVIEYLFTNKKELS